MMRKSAVIILGLMLTLTANAGVLVDRIVATVNNRPLLQSDWDDAVRFEAFLQDRAVASMTDEERRATLDRMIDQEVLRQQMQADFSSTPAEMAQRLAEVRAQIPGASSEQGWHAALARYGLSEASLRERLAMQLQVLSFVELRLRPAARVDRESVESYYNEKLLPELQNKGASAPPIAEVTPQIRELLRQQRIDELLATWLGNLRSQSTIHIVDGIATRRLAQGMNGAK